ncbi:hypothetical protein G4B88_023708 [Cannabis sativa]|uniref:Reverse transcriptase zinc-binding domain-containing protein n=1 Tax=Cannabis sativa TaxID=3483 RepID=A0A7J6HUX9_CANSA|nr:hypothetical protein G4B88_023708 [Cannabis sativa]
MSSDLWYWLHDASGVFTVKSAYSLLQSIKSNRDIPDSSGFWRLLWQLQLPPKVLNCMWRASTKSLPTRFHFSIKHVPIAATCPFCLAAPETTLHVLSKVPITAVAPDAMLFSSWFEAGLASWNTTEVLEADGDDERGGLRLVQLGSGEDGDEVVVRSWFMRGEGRDEVAMVVRTEKEEDRKIGYYEKRKFELAKNPNLRLL